MSNAAIYEELDNGINMMLSGGGRNTITTTSDLAEMIAIAAELRQMPRPQFRMRLATELNWQAAGRPISATPSATAADETSSFSTLFGKHGAMFPVQGKSMAASVALHAMMAVFAFVSLMVVKTSRILPMPGVQTVELTTFQPHPGITAPHGGGGGGDAGKVQASKGGAPRFSYEQLTPAVVLAPNREAKLKVEPTLVGPEMNLPKFSQTGDPLSKLMVPSNGVGVRGGIGSGDAGGIGSGSGSGYGPGRGGGSGGGIYTVGNGISAPLAIYTPEPEYSDEARKAKFQGVVTLLAVVGPDGTPKNLQVARSLGMGLDDKAIAAVKTWRFQPGMKDGHPVAVQISIEVNFHLF
jgi:periplasmic protein TonB